jgi:hypothetical protein
MALNLSEGPKWYKGTIVQKLGINVFNVHIDQLDVVWRRHSNQLLHVPYCTKPRQDDELFVSNPSVSSQPSDEVPAPITPTIPDAVPPENPVEAVETDVETPLTLRRSTRIRKPVIRYGIDE